MYTVKDKKPNSKNMHTFRINMQNFYNPNILVNTKKKFTLMIVNGYNEVDLTNFVYSFPNKQFSFLLS